jgi:DNA-binding protein YbaB
MFQPIDLQQKAEAHEYKFFGTKKQRPTSTAVRFNSILKGYRNSQLPPTMKLSLANGLPLLALYGTLTDAFAPVSKYLSSTATSSSSTTTITTTSTTESSTTTELHLFGGGTKSGDGAVAKKGPGMMDQLAMFKRAQEVAQMKLKLDNELAAETFEGMGADGKVKALCKMVPSKNPMDPQPEFEAAGFEFDDEWYESATPEELSAAVLAAIQDGREKTEMAATEKYKPLEEAFRDVMGGAAAAPES